MNERSFKMNIKFGFASLAAAACIHVSHADISASYGWEDGGTVLASFGNIVYSNSTANPYSGSAALALEEDPIGGTPNVTVAFITGLQDGDVIDASFFGWDDTPGSNASLRIWGHYGTSDDATSYEGSAGGNSTYTSGEGWDEMSHQWTFDSDGGSRDALMIEVRFYASSSSFGPLYVDDLFVNVSNDNAQIIFPAAIPAPGALALLGLAGLGRRRRNG